MGCVWDAYGIGWDRSGMDFAVCQRDDGRWLIYALDHEPICPRIGVVAVIAAPGSCRHSASETLAAPRSRPRLPYWPAWRRTVSAPAHRDHGAGRHLITRHRVGGGADDPDRSYHQT